MLFQPIRKNDDARYVPVVLVHDRDADGAQMLARMRSVAWQRLNFNALLVCPTFSGAYGFLQNGTGYGPGTDELLFNALAAQTEVKELTHRMLVFGFGDGAQYAHRLTMQHPRRVAGCVALSADSWTDPHGFCGGPMMQAGGFDEAPFDTEEVHAARKAACTEPTALPGVRWLVGASTDAPAHHDAAEQFRNDLARANSPAEAITWNGTPDQAGMAQMMSTLAFFNDVVAQPAELPPAPPKPVAVEAPAPVAPVEPANTPADPAGDQAANPTADAPSPDTPSEPGPDDSDAPLTHGRVESGDIDDADHNINDEDVNDDDVNHDDHDAASVEPALTAREREKLKPKPAPPALKPGQGNGFFDQLLRQQTTGPGDDPADG